MADSVLFLGWGNPVRGREQKATAVFGEAVEMWTKLESDGLIESWEAVFLDLHGGDLDGFFLIRGDRAQLAQVRDSEHMDRLLQRVGLVVEGIGLVGGATGERVQANMASYMESAAELG